MQELRALVHQHAALHAMRQQEANRLGSGALLTAVAQAMQAHVPRLEQQLADLTTPIDAHDDYHLIATRSGI